MNNVSEVRFAQWSIKISHNECGGIDRVCINDVCKALNRNGFFKDGTAVRKCPSVNILDESRPQEIYAKLDETIQFIQWMCTESKILAPSGHRLLRLLHKASIASPICQKSESDFPPPTEEVMELEYTGYKFTMKMCDGRYMVNATEMSRPFEKRPNVWLKSAEAIRVRQGLVDDGISKSLESQVFATRGPYGATWLEIHLWVHFAQWLSPAFAAWCSKKIVPLMKDGHVSMADEPAMDAKAQNTRPPQYDDLDIEQDSYLPVPENYETALAVIQTQHETIHKQREFIRHNKHKFEHYEETIESREWFTATMIANELGISAIQLNWFLMEENMLKKVDGQWSICREYRHLRDYHFYEWYNPKTKYTNKYKIDSWTPEGREYIIELWKKKNG